MKNSQGCQNIQHLLAEISSGEINESQFDEILALLRQHPECESVIVQQFENHQSNQAQKTVAALLLWEWKPSPEIKKFLLNRGWTSEDLES